MKIWVSRDMESRYVEIWQNKPKFDKESGYFINDENTIDEISSTSFGEITGIFVKEGEALYLDVQAVILERLTGELES